MSSNISNIDLQFLKSSSSEIIGSFDSSLIIQGVSLSSEEVRKDSLFVYVGRDENHAGEKLLKAVDNGAKAALWKKETPLPDNVPSHFPIFIVNDPLETIKALSRSYLEEIDPTIVGVIGCEGSTFTKELSSYLLAKNYKVAKSTEENKGVEGLCSLILNMDSNTTLLISEYDVNEADKMASFIPPQFAVMTDITPEFFHSKWSSEEIFQSFTKMEKEMAVTANLLIDGDNDKLKNYEWKTDVVGCGHSSNNLFQIESVDKKDDQIHFRLKGIYQPFTLSGLDEKYIKYTLFSIALSTQLGLFVDEAEERLKEFVLENFVKS